MTTKSHTHSNKHQSALQKFNLAFEYDRTWGEAKQTVQLRPTKK